GTPCDSNVSLISPILPTEVKANCNNGSIVVNWKDNSHVEYGYIVYRSSSANGTYQTLDTLPFNSTQYIDTSALANTSYWYKVASYNNIDTSYNNQIDSVTSCNVGFQKVISHTLKIYPNPASQSIVISHLSSVNTIEVNNLLGQHQHVTIEKLNTNDFRLTTEYLPSGIYFIKATDINGNVLNGKFVKE
ncbi:MAG: hypothetical protein RL708_680, partial [Bacteroidota bacterium]